jgi:hypothetical protein
MTDQRQISEPRVSENQQIMVTISLKHFNALVQAAGRAINPETAEVTSWYCELSDPYGVDDDLVDDLPEECRCSGRVDFACDPGTNLWIAFDDLPEATRDVLLKKHASKPAGLLDCLLGDQQ